MSDKADFFLKFFKVRRNVNNYIWSDIQDKHETVWVRVLSEKLNLEYCGILLVTEVFQRQPQIILGYYTKKDFAGNTLEDCFNQSEKRVLIDTSIYDCIEIIYDKNSDKLKLK